LPESADQKQQYLYLTTLGRKTVQPREIEIWFTQYNGLYYVIAEYSTSHWVRNLQAEPHVQVRMGDTRFSAVARVILPENEPELNRAVQDLSRAKYGWGEGLVIELAPTDTPS
jgi:deazaflavin-dependent oxidoreductase (nitroreductase family)